MTPKKEGLFSDPLNIEEVEFSKEFAQALESCSPWANKLLKSKKIMGALSVKKNSNQMYDDLNAIKSALFEIRFAYAIHKAGLNAEYEFLANVGGSSVDFRVMSKPEWLVELTGLRESDAVKESTKITGNTFEYLSISNGKYNSPEVRDIVKVQRALCIKVSDSKIPDNKGNPIKFPIINSGSYHMILIDMRGFNAGSTDCYDYWNIAYGSASLINISDGIYCRFWLDKGNPSMIKGVFDDDHLDARSIYLRERIHVLGFISEREYGEGSLFDKLNSFQIQDSSNVEMSF